MYDLCPSVASSSTAPPPSPHHRHHHHGHHTHHHVHHRGNHRSHSPISHISTLLPHSHQSQYSPSTRAADISRLLDPAYASASSSSGSSTCTSPTQHKNDQTRAYVDRNGDLHDPDYRDFPVLSPQALPSISSRYKRRRSDGTTTRSSSTSRNTDRRYSSTTYSAMTRPEWERDWSHEIEDEDREMEDADENESQSHYSPFASTVNMRRSASIHTAHTFKPYTSYSQFIVGEPQPIASSPTVSMDDEHGTTQIHDSPLQESPFLPEEPEQLVEEARRSSGHSSILRRGSKKSESKVHEASLSEKVAVERSSQRQMIAHDGHMDSRFVSPTCVAALRQQWQATLLRFRFGIYHAKRRLSVRSRR
ncbi:uncharacterized protein LAESUDRAFT_674317, partial [Laetiporus sulphureus 93-53]